MSIEDTLAVGVYVRTLNRIEARLKQCSQVQESTQLETESL